MFFAREIVGEFDSWFLPFKGIRGAIFLIMGMESLFFFRRVWFIRHFLQAARKSFKHFAQELFIFFVKFNNLSSEIVDKMEYNSVV